jgi:hypothetical protein
MILVASSMSPSFQVNGLAPRPLRPAQGAVPQGRVGDREDRIGRSVEAGDETHDVEDDWAIVVPAGWWHNVVNTGDGDLKLYALYAPPEHPGRHGPPNEGGRDGRRARLTVRTARLRGGPGR